MDWSQAAWCRARVDEDFAGAVGGTEARRLAELCRIHCPVVERCLAEALRAEGNANTSSRIGVWGGTLPGERVVLARAAGREAQPARDERTSPRGR